MFSIIADRGFLRRARVSALAGGQGLPDASTHGVSVAGFASIAASGGQSDGLGRGGGSGWKARATMNRTRDAQGEQRNRKGRTRAGKPELR